ncbi:MULTISPECIES: arginase family protein [Photorhabdus]|uniref:Agmatinase n=1 Tax=Photorhabdus thracensis TaxID=230089 RepID=A0A0F7LTM2_9GAMM|nr:arginase family protein [Photorhabdus thracensis]AKH65233.1 agmatinase [Photorhabdus thracensis]
MKDRVNLRYRVHPGLRYDPVEPGRIEISIPFGTKQLRASSKIGSLLEQIKAEVVLTGENIVQRLGSSVFEAMVKYHFLLPENASAALEGGLCIPVPEPAGQSVSVFDLNELQADDAVLLHAPILTTTGGEISVAGGGQRVRSQLVQCLRHPLGTAGRGVLLDLDFGTQLASEQLRLFDLGDVVYRPGMDSATDVGERLAYVCRNIVERDACPIILGGDHAQAFHSISALAERYPRLGILQFDAHPDLYAMGAHCDLELNHANVMHWVRRMPHVASIWQIGIRDFFQQPTENLRLEVDPNLHVLPAFEAETVGYDRLLRNMDRSLPWFISFDVDVLSGTEVPQTATPVLGGLSFYPLLACFERLLSEFRVIGMEFVEIGNASQGAHGADAVATRLLSRYLFHLSKAVATSHCIYSPLY